MLARMDLFSPRRCRLTTPASTITLKKLVAPVTDRVGLTYGSTEGNANQFDQSQPRCVGHCVRASLKHLGERRRLFSPGTLVNGSPFSLGPRIASIAPDNAKKGAALPFEDECPGKRIRGASSVLIDWPGCNHCVHRPRSPRGRACPASVTGISGRNPVQVRTRGATARSTPCTLTIIPHRRRGSRSPRGWLSVGSGAVHDVREPGLNFGFGTRACPMGTPAFRRTVTAAKI